MRRALLLILMLLVAAHVAGPAEVQAKPKSSAKARKAKARKARARKAKAKAEAEAKAARLKAEAEAEAAKAAAEAKAEAARNQAAQAKLKAAGARAKAEAKRTGGVLQPHAKAQQGAASPKGRLSAALAKMKAGDFPGAAADLDRYVKAEDQELDTARYNLAKALYRMGAYHSSMRYFSQLLAEGPQGRYYQTSLEWCLFISRKMKDDAAVNDLVARYAAGGFPKDYEDEFYYRLARFHLERALAIEAGEIAGKLGETKIQETVTGGKSITGDVFGDDPVEGEAEVTRKDDGGFSLGDDLFGDPEPSAAAAADKAAAKRSGSYVLNAKEHTQEALRLVQKVKQTSPYGARAKYLEGLVLYKVGRENDALAAFKTVVRLTGPKGAEPNPKLRELAFFQLARTHFGAQQPSFSIFYYRKVDRDSVAWLDSLYEESWARFRLGDYEKALGNLLTLHAPFFTDEYYPESLILKAVIYYENCRYYEAKKILAAFLKRYEPVHKELSRLTTSKKTAEQYYETLQNMQAEDLADAHQGQAKIVSQVLSIALSDPELVRLRTATEEIDGEIQTLNAQNGLGEVLRSSLLSELKAKRDKLKKETGRAVKNQLERERVHIQSLLGQAIRIDIETARSEQERIESKLRAVQQRPKARDQSYVEWTDDEKQVWPFSGEYWRDELGTYELTLAHSCR